MTRLLDPDCFYCVMVVRIQGRRCSFRLAAILRAKTSCLIRRSA